MQNYHLPWVTIFNVAGDEAKCAARRFFGRVMEMLKPARRAAPKTSWLAEAADPQGPERLPNCGEPAQYGFTIEPSRAKPRSVENPRLGAAPVFWRMFRGGTDWSSGGNRELKFSGLHLLQNQKPDR
ncbi:hypothetical protein [Roseicella frigidaeris]|uniref:hypothetical protein n=1 Tax=Roseicella frigidaeris TaxID=2230885 RepID=UPI000FDE16DF|nr:hypothetical protein [Roseicella frigidaeris]